MALWDLAGRLTNLPVYKLLGGPFRDQVPIFVNTEPRNMLDPKAVKDWADQFRANPLGFKGAKCNGSRSLPLIEPDSDRWFSHGLSLI
jgi:L-alanine-DL-glutamate epimerase-like enolase superfamily enzyme